MEIKRVNKNYSITLSKRELEIIYGSVAHIEGSTLDAGLKSDGLFVDSHERMASADTSYNQLRKIVLGEKNED